MKKVRFLFLILALVLVVGMTTGLIVRKQTGGQTVMQHSAQAPAQTTPATTGDDEPAAPEETSPALGLLDHSKVPLYVNVPDEGLIVEISQNGETLEPVSRIELPYDSGAISGAKGGGPHFNEICDLYFLDPSIYTIRLVSDSKSDPGNDDDPDPYFTRYVLYYNSSSGYPVTYEDNVCLTSNTYSASGYLTIYLDFYNTIQVD